MPAATPPRALNHIGITVPDIFAAIDWYRELFGFTHLLGPRVLQSASQATHETPSIFGPRFKKAYQAHLMTANGIGLELFQFVEPAVETPADNMEYWKRGYWHLCFTDPDIEGLAARIVATGGRQRCPVYAFIPGRPYKLVYCEDPFGNVIELFSHHYAEAFGNWPQPGMDPPPTFISREQHAAEMREAAYPAAAR
jgi:catechol 2,3-dioxygenase-like lactoylglutathione lyase family enzyme